jgi:hypothetical protein
LESQAETGFDDHGLSIEGGTGLNVAGGMMSLGFQPS